MTPAEAQLLLGIAASFDNRKPSEEAAIAWSHALGDLPFVDCRDAIVAHYQRTTDWLMPGHVITAVRLVRAKRIADGEGQLTPPPDAREGDAHRRWLREAKRRLGDGEAVEAVNPPALDGKPRHLPDIRELMPAPDTERTTTDV